MLKSNIYQWPHRASRTDYPLLEDILQPRWNPSYKIAQAKIQLGLDTISLDLDAADSAIRQIPKFTGSRSKTKLREAKEDTTTKKYTPVEYPRDINIRAHTVLQGHMPCTCHDGNKQKARGDHLVRLLLWPPMQNHSDARLAQFDMLISSAPCGKDS